jgi:hypothetical protein
VGLRHAAVEPLGHVQRADQRMGGERADTVLGRAGPRGLGRQELVFGEGGDEAGALLIGFDGLGLAVEAEMLAAGLT